TRPRRSATIHWKSARRVTRSPTALPTVPRRSAVLGSNAAMGWDRSRLVIPSARTHSNRLCFLSPRRRDMNATTDGARRLITEEIPVASSELIERVRGLLAEGTVRHIKVKSPNGEVYFEVPLAIGLLGGAALAWASPWLA